MALLENVQMPPSALNRRPQGRDETTRILQIVHPSGIGIGGMEKLTMLHVNRHAETVRNLPIAREVLVRM